MVDDGCATMDGYGCRVCVGDAPESRRYKSEVWFISWGDMISVWYVIRSLSCEGECTSPYGECDGGERGVCGMGGECVEGW